MAAAETFAHIFYNQGVSELIPFLLGLSPKEVVAVRKRLLEFSGFYCEREESAMLFLTGLAVYSSKEAFKTGFHWSGSLAHDFFDSREAEVTVILAHFRPEWLSKWILGRDGSSLVDYWRVRQLQEAGFIDYDPERFTALLGWQAVSPHTRQSLLPKLAQDAIACQRDLMLLFEYTETIPRLDCHSYYQYEAYTWVAYLVELAALGQLNRKELLRRSLLALRGDLRRPVLTWFKTLFVALSPAGAERLELQADLVELLAHPQTMVVNFAFDQLRNLWSEEAFSIGPFLLQSENLAMRQDLKTGLRALLGNFEKLLQRDPTQASVLGRICATALANADLGVQEKAAHFLVVLLSRHQHLLATDDTAALLATMALYDELLTPTTRALLGAWLAPLRTKGNDACQPPVEYQPHTGFSPQLSPENAIVAVKDWHELLFLTGQVLHHPDSVAFERWLDGLLQLQGEFPSDYAEQLHPYVKELEEAMVPVNHDGNSIDRAQMPTSPLDAAAVLWLYGHRGLTQALTLSWASKCQVLRVSQVWLRNAPHWTSDPLMFVESRRLQLVESRLQQHIALPLLSTPTHAPAWVAPLAFVQRLLDYQHANQEPDATDFTLALTRLAHKEQPHAEAAWALLPGLQHEGIRALLNWVLQAEEKAVPVAQTAAAIRKGDAAPWPALANALPELWAVAARTKFPKRHFPELTELSKWFAPTIPEVVGPVAVHWAAEAKSYTETRNWGRYQAGEVSHWHQITVTTTPSDVAIPSDCLLLYSLHEAIWHQGTWSPSDFFEGLRQDFLFLVALVPQHRSPLYWHALRCGTYRNDTKPSASELLQQVLRSMLDQGEIFEEVQSVLLAAGLVHHVPECRALAMEVLLTSIASHRLVPSDLGRAVGKLLAVEFAPVQRFSDALPKVRALDALTDDAVQQILNALLLELPTKPLRNTQKLLEGYAELKSCTSRTMPEYVEAKLKEWSHSPALKKTIHKIL